MVHTAYCDESEDSKPGGRFYVVSGYLGEAKNWTILSQAWSNALDDEGLPEFHMADCVAGKGLFVDRSLVQRSAIQRRFIALLAGSPIWGHSAAIQKRHYSEMAERFKNARGKYAKPYFLAFQHLVESMTIELDEVRHIGADEKLAFFFDRQDEYKGRAKEIFESLAADDRYRSNKRIGTLTFASRLDVIPLQCADILAYENMRYLRDYRHGLAAEPRWQWELLKISGRVQGRIMTRPELQIICNLQGW